MPRSHSCALLLMLALTTGAVVPGCGSSTQPEGTASPAASASGKKTGTKSGDGGETAQTAESGKRKFAPVSLDDTPAADIASEAKTGGTVDKEKNAQSIVAALQPFQIMLGKWRGVTKKQFDGFAASEELEWVWDFKTDRAQPSLTIASDKSPYFRKGWLTYLPAEDAFQFTGNTPDGNTRVFQGTWTDGGEPQEVYEGKRAERTYKLELTQVSPEDGEQWQVVFNQQDNNRYLMELRKRPPAGMRFGPLDVVGTQRQGTSFAVADSDNPGPKCVVSGGLGTIKVSYQGKEYYVCCSGCVAAFNDEPERWLAKLAEAQKMKAQDE